MRGSRRAIVLAATGGAAAATLLVLASVPLLALTHRDELPLERRLGAAAIGVVVAIAAGDAANPVAGDARALAAGRAAYTGSCAICHGAAGDGRGRFGASTYPNAADLRSEAVRGRTDAQLHWVVRNGLSFTGMPAFADVYEDRELWAIVAYVRALQAGTTTAFAVPPPAPEQLARADPRGDAAARGRAVFFAQGCHLCHGAFDGPPGLDLAGRAGTHVVRGDQPGMPSFGRDRISDEELADLETFLVAQFAR